MGRIQSHGYGLWCLIALAASSCSYYHPGVIPTIAVEHRPNEGSMLVIQPQNVDMLGELDRFSPGDMSPIVAIAFDDIATTLRFAQASGLVGGIHLPSRQVSTQHLGELSLRSAAFCDSGDFLMSAGAVPNTPITHTVASVSNNITVWNARTWQQQKPISPALAQTAMAIGRSCRWVIGTQEASFDPIDTSGKIGRQFIGQPRSISLDAVAIDNREEFVALAARSGELFIYDLSKGKTELAAQIRLVEPLYVNDSEWQPYALAFDPTRRYLALIANARLLLVDLHDGSTYLNEKVANTQLSSAALTFDPSGRLLAIGTTEGWQLWDVKDKIKLMDHVGDPVLALEFSKDARLLALGDARGIVRIWGQKQHN